MNNDLVKRAKALQADFRAIVNETPDECGELLIAGVDAYRQMQRFVKILTKEVVGVVAVGGKKDE
jgi:hypothetical protein